MNPLRIAILGCPSHPHEPWSQANLRALRDLGFNTIQLNIAWGSRPADEPLNLEDIVELSPALAKKYPQVVPLRSAPTAVDQERRRQRIRERIPLAREAGFRTIFHFGAPFNAHLTYGDNPPNCLADPLVIQRHERLLDQFATDFPGVDDLLFYTYDQDAWLCSEFGDCPRCQGVPLHGRVVAFVEKLAAKWRLINPDGRLWWEPWELSAGQVLQALDRIGTTGIGMMLHANIAEVMVTMPVDRFVRNACALAASRGVPVVLEGFLGAPTEEVEPFRHLQTPLTAFRHAKALSTVPGSMGVKEYYGLLPSKEDPNLRASALALAEPNLPEEEMLAQLARAYVPASDEVIRYWRLTSESMELYPWDASWWGRCLGMSDPNHALTAAYLRGQQAHTPSWESTRRAIFMKTDDLEADPWLLEDVQLRMDLAAERLDAAWRLGSSFCASLSEDLRGSFEAGLADLAGFRQRVVAYACHLRATNLATLLRRLAEEGKPLPGKLLIELSEVLIRDRENSPVKEPLTSALALLAETPDTFLKTYFLPTRELTRSRGDFSVTSR